MSSSLEQLIAAVGTDGLGEEHAFESIRTTALELGFEFVSFRVCLSLPVGKLKTTIRHNHPESWVSLYESRCYLKTDPTVAWAMGSAVPLLWSDSSATAPEFWADAGRHGLMHGWTQGLSVAPGETGILSLARSSEPISSSELSKHEVRWRALSAVARFALMRSMRAKLVKEQSGALTPREREVLKWAAAGKTQQDISAILAIAIDTVKFHLQNACRKLDCTNTTQAVAHAALLGSLC